MEYESKAMFFNCSVEEHYVSHQDEALWLYIYDLVIYGVV